MKKLFYLVCILSISISYSQNTFRLWHFNAKAGTEEAIGNPLSEHNNCLLYTSDAADE